MRPLGIVADQEVFQVLLHLLKGLIEFLSTLDAQVLFEQRSVEPLHEPVASRLADRGGAVLDLLQLQEEFIGCRSGQPQNSVGGPVSLLFRFVCRDSNLGRSAWLPLPLKANCQVNTITPHEART